MAVLFSINATAQIAIDESDSTVIETVVIEAEVAESEPLEESMDLLAEELEEEVAANPTEAASTTESVDLVVEESEPVQEVSVDPAELLVAAPAAEEREPVEEEIVVVQSVEEVPVGPEDVIVEEPLHEESGDPVIEELATDSIVEESATAAVDPLEEGLEPKPVEDADVLESKPVDLVVEESTPDLMEMEEEDVEPDLLEEGLTNSVVETQEPEPVVEAVAIEEPALEEPTIEVLESDSMEEDSVVVEPVIEGLAPVVFPEDSVAIEPVVEPEPVTVMEEDSVVVEPVIEGLDPVVFPEDSVAMEPVVEPEPVTVVEEDSVVVEPVIEGLESISVSEDSVAIAPAADQSDASATMAEEKTGIDSIVVALEDSVTVAQDRSVSEPLSEAPIPVTMAEDIAAVAVLVNTSDPDTLAVDSTATAGEVIDGDALDSPVPLETNLDPTVLSEGKAIQAKAELSGRLDFGAVLLNTQSEQPLLIENTGNDRLVIHSFAVDNRLFFVAPDSLIIEPGKAGLLTVYFAPVNLGSQTAHLLLLTNLGQREVLLQGAGLGRDVVFVPAPLDYFRVAVIMINRGTEEVQIDQVEVLSGLEGLARIDPVMEVDIRQDTAWVTTVEFMADLAIGADDVSLHITGPGLNHSLRINRPQPPRLVAATPRLKFVSTDPESPSTQHLELYNSGGDTLRISAIYADSQAFEIATDPFVLAPQASGVIQVQYWPQGHRSIEATLTIESNDPAGPLVIAMQAGPAPDTRWPTEMVLGANYPNPFNPQTIIPYQLSQAGKVELEIYDILGRRVRTLVHQTQAQGYYESTWDGRDNGEKPVASGIYLYRLQVESFVVSRKLILMR